MSWSIFHNSFKFEFHFQQALWDSQDFVSSHQVSRQHSGGKTNLCKEKPKFVWISKKPNWVPAEWCWWLRFESTMKYFVKISINNNKISHCALRCSAISTIQRYSIWLLLNTNKCGLFSKDFFSVSKRPLEALTRRNRSRQLFKLWSEPKSEPK